MLPGTHLLPPSDFLGWGDSLVWIPGLLSEEGHRFFKVYAYVDNVFATYNRKPSYISSGSATNTTSPPETLRHPKGGRRRGDGVCGCDLIFGVFVQGVYSVNTPY
jgi:hypothetical protein